MNKWFIWVCLIVCSIEGKAQYQSYSSVNLQSWDTTQLEVNQYQTGVTHNGMDSIVGFRVAIDQCNTSTWTSASYIIYCDSAHDDTLDLDFTFTPQGLLPGRHTITVATLDKKGRMSVPQTLEFYILPYLDSAEYFIDEDPGVGQGIPLSLTDGDSCSQTYSLNTPNNISSGSHTIYVRTRESRGGWSMVEASSFYVTSVLVSGEYFYDADPGPGNGTSFTYAHTDSFFLDTSFSIPNSLGPGNHTLYIRTKDNSGNWGLYEAANFYITSALVSGEYFFDQDPGPGNGTAFSFSTTDSISENYSISTNGLSTGPHQLYIRTKGNNGTWSLYEKQNFYIQPRIVAYKYWIDTIPQFNSTGVKIDIPQQNWGDSLILSTQISLACLDTGRHYVWVSVQDENGNWSDVEYDTFQVTPGTNVSLSHHTPGPGPVGSPILLQASGGGGANYRYRDVTMGGAFQENAQFLIPNDSTHIFQVKDTCGNFDYDTITAPSEPADLSTLSGSGYVVFSGFGEWVYVQDSLGKIIAAINDQGNDLDTTFVLCNVHHDSLPFRLEPTGNYYYLDRNWYIYSKNAPTSNVDVRLFWLNHEEDSLVMVDPSIDSIQQCPITKYSGPNQNLVLDDNSFGGSYSTLFYPTYGNYQGTNTSGRYAQISVSSFSEFYVGNGGGVPLSLYWIYAFAHLNQDKPILEWAVNQNKNITHFLIEQRNDRGQWQPIDQIAVENLNHFQWQGKAGVKTELYFKISAWQSNMKIDETEILKVKPSELAHVSQIFPNPTQGRIHFRFPESIAGNVTWINQAGKIVMVEKVSGKNYDTDLSHLPSGVYTAKVDIGQSETPIMVRVILLR